MAFNEPLFVFRIDGKRHALPLSATRGVTHAVAMTPLPSPPRHVRGMINVRGEIVPVIDMRGILNLPDRPVRLSDQIVLAEAHERTVAFYVDQSDEVVEAVETMAADAQRIFPGMKAVLRGVAKIEGELAPICDLGLLLPDETMESWVTTERALAEMDGPPLGPTEPPPPPDVDR